jgi:hypothetical protein
MHCFTLEWLEQVLIMLVVFLAVFAILKVLIPWVISMAGVAIPGPVMQIINIFIWALIAIAVIYFAFMVISCLMSMSGGIHLPR